MKLMLAGFVAAVALMFQLSGSAQAAIPGWTVYAATPYACQNQTCDFLGEVYGNNYFNGQYVYAYIYVDVCEQQLVTGGWQTIYCQDSVTSWNDFTGEDFYGSMPVCGRWYATYSYGGVEINGRWDTASVRSPGKQGCTA